MSTTPNDKQDGDPAVHSSDWLAAFCRYHASDYSLHASQEEAEAEMKAGEDEGECYGVATYHIPTKTDRKSTRLNSSHLGISYAVFCLKKKEITYDSVTIHVVSVMAVTGDLVTHRT